jgi:RNA polymerase sigma-70 factor (ECF subfamily)
MLKRPTSLRAGNGGDGPLSRASMLEPTAEELFESQLAGLQPRLLAVALRITRDPESARDAVQAGLEKALRHRDSFRGEALLSTWVHRIVANEALMSLRSEQRRREVPQETAGEISDPRLGAADRLLARERRALLRDGLTRLSALERDLLERCALSGWSYAEYSARTGTHVAAVKSRAFRARRRLRALLIDA